MDLALFGFVDDPDGDELDGVTGGDEGEQQLRVDLKVAGPERKSGPGTQLEQSKAALAVRQRAPGRKAMVVPRDGRLERRRKLPEAVASPSFNRSRAAGWPPRMLDRAK